MTPKQFSKQTNKSTAQHNPIKDEEKQPTETSEEGSKGGVVDKQGSKDGPIPLVDFLWENRDD